MPSGTMALDGTRMRFYKQMRARFGVPGSSTLEAQILGCHLQTKSHRSHLSKQLIALKKKMYCLLKNKGKYCTVFILLKQLLSNIKSS